MTFLFFFYFRLTIVGGAHVQMLQRGFKTFTLDEFDVPKKLKKQGMDDPNMVCNSNC